MDELLTTQPSNTIVKMITPKQYQSLKNVIKKPLGGRTKGEIPAKLRHLLVRANDVIVMDGSNLFQLKTRTTFIEDRLFPVDSKTAGSGWETIFLKSKSYTVEEFNKKYKEGRDKFPIGLTDQILNSVKPADDSVWQPFELSEVFTDNRGFDTTIPYYQYGTCKIPVDVIDRFVEIAGGLPTHWYEDDDTVYFRCGFLTLISCTLNSKKTQSA